MNSVKVKPMSRALRVILSMSIISFLLSLYYSCTPCFLHSLDLTFKQFINKKPAFLFSIIILVFLAARDCRMLSSSTVGNHLYHEFTAVDGHHVQNFEIVLVVKEEAKEEEEEEPQSKNENDHGHDHEDEEEEEEEEEDMEVTDELDHLHIDELNRRFEEFIMREKRRRSSEALQLVML